MIGGYEDLGGRYPGMRNALKMLRSSDRRDLKRMIGAHKRKVQIWRIRPSRRDSPRGDRSEGPIVPHL